MELRQKTFNNMRDLVKFVNENSIPKENILNTFQDAEKQFILLYTVDE